MSYIRVYVILYVNGHIYVGFLHKDEGMNEHSRLYIKIYIIIFGKPKNRTLKALIQKKSRIIEPSGKLLFLFSQKRRQKVKRLFLMTQKKYF